MSLAILSQMLILLSLSVIVIYIGLKLKIPSIVGFLLTGILVGPHGLKIISDHTQIDSLAELGVVLLLFTIGLEFSVTTLIKIRRVVLLGGSLQVFLCTVFTFILAKLLGFPWNTSLLLGFLFSLSSTAIVLKLLQEHGEMDSPHGQASLGVLIFQDLAVVPMVLALPIMAGQNGGDPIYYMIFKAALLVIFILFMAYYAVPAVLKKMADTKSRELFMFTVVLICLGTAFLTYKAGLSMALGAFVAGLVISNSSYAYQAISTILPMKDIFTSLFFVSIGMMMNLNYLQEHPMLSLGAAFCMMLINISGTTIAMRIAGLNWRVSIMVAFALCQIGEFSFVLAKDGVKYNLLTSDNMALFLNAAVISMALTPFAIFMGKKLAPFFKENRKKLKQKDATKSGHVIVIGYGVVGQGVTNACDVAGIPYQILEMNPHTVQVYQEKKVPISYGDAVNEEVLDHVNLTQAKAIVVTIPDPVATRRIVSTAKMLNPDIYVIARTRFLLEMENLYKLGADEVIPEEYETAVAAFRKVMFKFMVPVEVIEKQMAKARASQYSMFRNFDKKQYDNSENFTKLIKGLDFFTVTVQQYSFIEGKTLSETALRADYGLTVIMVKRGDAINLNPAADFKFAEQDLVVCLSSDVLKTTSAIKLFHAENEKGN